MAKLEAYDKSLDYSYAPGIFPATECLNNAGGRCLRLLLSSSSEKSEGAKKLRERAEAAGVRVEIADRALERISKKENCFAAMVYKKQEGVFSPDAPHIVLVNPSDSGNLGTILRTALGFGNEATGLPDVFAEYGTSTLIPHSGKIDSLNLAIAAGIGMYAFTHRD